MVKKELTQKAAQVLQPRKHLIFTLYVSFVIQKPSSE